MKSNNFISIITGGAGFIGSNLADYLVQKNHKVIILDNFSSGRIENLKKIKNKIKIIKCDISKDKKILFNNIKKADYVFHLAGLADIVPSIENPEKYFQANVVGTFNVLIASQKAKIKKLVYAASASCYGIPKKIPINEKDKISTMYPYSLTKYLGEELVLHWKKVYKLPCVSLRFFNVYGPRSRTSGAYGAMFGVFLAQKLASKPLTIVGNGKQTRDFIHVSDLVNIIHKVAISQKKIREVYNVGSGKETKVSLIANMISKNQIYIPKRPGEPDRSLAGIKNLKKDFKWTPKVSIKKGVDELLNNIFNWKNAPVWTPSKIKNQTKSWFKYLK